MFMDSRSISDSCEIVTWKDSSEWLIDVGIATKTHQLYKTPFVSHHMNIEYNYIFRVKPNCETHKGLCVLATQRNLLEATYSDMSFKTIFKSDFVSNTVNDGWSGHGVAHIVISTFTGCWYKPQYIVPCDHKTYKHLKHLFWTRLVGVLGSICEMTF